MGENSQREQEACQTIETIIDLNWILTCRLLEYETCEWSVLGVDWYIESVVVRCPSDFSASELQK